VKRHADSSSNQHAERHSRDDRCGPRHSFCDGNSPPS
jgi:hypothetical protein